MWLPKVSPKQLSAMQLCHPRPGRKKYVLLSGPRQATKSMAAFHAIADNLWNVDKANFTMVAPTVTAGDDQGCWSIMTEHVLPEWIAGGFGMKWIKEPKQSGVSKKLYCVVSNKFGGQSRLQLDSLQYEEEVEDRFKNKNYSGLYISELSYFKERATFDAWMEVLRGPQYKEQDYLFLGDTNPADEGTDSWIYKLWYEYRVEDAEGDEGKRLFQEQLALMEFAVSDNIFKDANWHLLQKAKYAHSQDLLARYYYGKWVKASDNSLFYEQLKPSVHFVGDSPSASAEPEMLLPQENCFELRTGWDPGTTNQGCVIYEKAYALDAKDRKVSIFNVLDEVVYIKSNSSLIDFTEEVVERIDWWEEFMGRELLWRHYSDRSVFDAKIIGDVYPHHVIYNASGHRKITLIAVDRKPGSVHTRVDMVRRLLFENRLYISRNKCPLLMESLQSLPKGKGNSAIQKNSQFKHAFDALSYALISECFDELYQPQDAPNVQAPSGVTSVAL